MKTLGGFRMGPFELMDFIGNDVNYIVTETVFKAFYSDPRYNRHLHRNAIQRPAIWEGKQDGDTIITAKTDSEWTVHPPRRAQLKHP